MRKAAEALHDFGVALRPPQGVGQSVACEPGEELERARLDRSTFRMLKRHVEKPPLEERELAIRTLRHGPVRGGERFDIARECARRAAKRIARELIEEQHARDASARGRRPLPIAAGERKINGCAEALADLAIERIVLAEPFGTLDTGCGAEPERKDFFVHA